MKRQIRKEILSLALPVIFTSLLQQAVSIIDIILVGGLGPSAITAVGIAQLLIFVLMTVAWGLSSGTMVVMAQLWGAQRKKEAGIVGYQALVIGTLLGLALSLGGVLVSQRGAVFLGARPDVLSLTAPYLGVIFSFFLFALLVNILSAIFYAVGNTKIPFHAAVLINLLHVIIAYPLIYGVGGAPQLGVTGAAVGVGLSELAGAFYLVFFGLKHRYILPGPMNRSILRHVFHVGFPVFADRLLQQSGQLFYLKVIMLYGTIAYAAHQVGLAISAFSFLPALGISIATTTAVGQRLGADQKTHASLAHQEATRLAVTIMAAMGLLFLFAPSFLFRAFTQNPEVIRQGTQFLRIIAFLQIPLALAMVLTGSLRGAGDTGFLFWTTVAGSWGIRIPLAWIFALYFKWELAAVWSLLIIDWSVRMLLLTYRHRSVKGKAKTLLPPDSENQGFILAPVRNE